jgi:hypothetical protein
MAEEKPKLAYVLERLRASTGLRFVVADNLAHHDPDLDDLHRKNELAYTYMEILAKRGLDDGRWEKIEGGYCLEGESWTPRPAPPRSFAWAWVTGGLLLTLTAAGGGAFVIYRRRGKQLAANPSREIPKAKTPAPKKKPT